MPRSRKLNAHNTEKLRVRAPDVVEAVMYLDQLQAKGHRLTVRLRCGTHEAYGDTVLSAINMLKIQRGE